jgi:N-(2-amino-2-carboxyethyl)-L-glutamate synthase
MAAFAKLEQFNQTKSHKDRAARFLIDTFIRTGQLHKGARHLVSSSGNFALSYAHYTNGLDVLIEFVTDKLSSQHLIDRVKAYPHVNTTIVDNPDETGSHLKARLRLIDQIMGCDPNAVFVGQYDNFVLPLAYEQSLAPEIDHQLGNSLRTVLVPVGTGALLNGIVRYKTHHGKSWRVIAVDASGSALFHIPLPGTKRRLPGYGNGMRCGLVRHMPPGLDAVVHVEDSEVMAACNLLRRNGLCVGPSSGATVAALNYLVRFRPEFLSSNSYPLLIFPDSGDAYMDTVYDPTWLRSKGLIPEAAKEAKHGDTVLS